MIPKKIKIGGLIWSVEENKNVCNENDCFGSAHYRNQKIFIEPTETQLKKEHTLLHEIMHAIWWQCGLNERMKEIKGITEEEIITALSFGLYQVIKDNKIIE
jgi:hypothetical protein